MPGVAHSRHGHTATTDSIPTSHGHVIWNFGQYYWEAELFTAI